MTAYFDAGDWFAYGYWDGYAARWWDDVEGLDYDDYQAYMDGYRAGMRDEEADR